MGILKSLVGARLPEGEAVILGKILIDDDPRLEERTGVGHSSQVRCREPNRHHQR